MPSKKKVKIKKNKSDHRNSTTQSISSFSKQIINTLLAFSNSKIMLWVLIFTVTFAVLAYYPDHGGDYDIWWHLKYGEYYVNNMTWHLDHSMFSWTPSLSGWEKVTWLGSSFLYLVYKIGAFPGLNILKWIIFSIIVFLFLRFIKFVGDSFDINHLLGLLLVAVAINPTAIFLKPEMFTLLFFAIIVYVYFKSKLYSKNYFYLYPVVFVLWINIHAGYVIGLFFVSLLLCGEVCSYLFFKRTCMPGKLLLRFIVFVGISYAVLVINPYGISFLINHFNRLVSRDMMADRLHVTSYINRWEYLFPGVYVFRRTNAAWAMVFMQVIVIATFIYAYLKKKYFDITIIGINLVFFYLGMKMARVTIYFPLIWLFTELYVLKQIDTLHIKYKYVPFALITVIAGSGVCLYCILAINTYTSWFGSHMDELVPVNEVNYIMENTLPAPLFNDYLIGGYMIWEMYPRYKVFIDPRYQPYAQGVWDDYIGFRQKPDNTNLVRIMTKYPFKTAFIHHIRYSNIVLSFLKSPEWHLMYFDKIAAVFVHSSEVNSGELQSLQADFGTDRFRDVTNPTILYSLFNIYYEIAPDKAREIMHIYQKKVRNMYIYKKRQIATMNSMLSLR